MYFSVMYYVNVAGRSSARGIQCSEMAIFKLHMRKYLANGKQYGHGYYELSMRNRMSLFCCRFRL